MLNVLDLENKDFSNLRKIIEALAIDLTKKVYYYNYVYEDGEYKLYKLYVPFYYSLVGGESYMYDYFLKNKLICVDDENKIANYELIPRGILNLSGISIENNGLINKFNRENIQKVDDDNILKEYNLQFQYIPLNLIFEVNILTSDILNTMKIIEKLIEVLYKNQFIEINLGNIKLGSMVITMNYKMPETYGKENAIEFSFDGEKKVHKINFDIILNVPYPVFEYDTIIHNGTRIFDALLNVYHLFDIESGNLPGNNPY